MATKKQQAAIIKAVDRLTAIQTAIRNAMLAIGKVHDAQSTAQSAICDASDKMWEGWKPAPKNVEALVEFISRAKDDAIKVGLKDEFAGTRWENYWRLSSAYLHSKVMPSVTATYGKDKTVKASEINRASPKQAIEAVAKEIRRLAGTGRNKRPKVEGGQTTQHNAADIARAQIKTFEVNAESVRQLVERVLSMQSGIGLLHDALKAHGWSVLRLAPKSWNEEPKKTVAIVGFEQQTAAVKAAANAAMKKVAAKAARRTGKK